jgi:hypothetical protein
MTKGVHFDNFKKRWIAKMQKHGIVKRKGFIDENDAKSYRLKLEKEFDNMDINNQLNQLASQNDPTTTVPQNHVRQREHKVVEYFAHYQPFSETNLITGETRSDRFFVPGYKCEVLHENADTVVTLENEFVGKTTCDVDSIYSRKTGLKIAYNLAMIEKLKKEIEELSN